MGIRVVFISPSLSCTSGTGIWSAPVLSLHTGDSRYTEGQTFVAHCFYDYLVLCFYHNLRSALLLCNADESGPGDIRSRTRQCRSDAISGIYEGPNREHIPLHSVAFVHVCKITRVVLSIAKRIRMLRKRLRVVMSIVGKGERLWTEGWL